MKQIQTGKGTIPIMTLFAIWAISLVVNLPGLAISPILGDLDKIFPHASHLEIQLLSLLPNFFIFPFILLSGKLSTAGHKVFLVILGLSIFLACGIAYLFAKSMVALIVISCILGIGCGLVIPLAAGLLAENFTGRYRVQQLGIKSGMANVTLVAATLIVGGVSAKNWHLPFLVYLAPIIPLVLSPFLASKFLKNNQEKEACPVDYDPALKVNPATPAPAVEKKTRLRILGIFAFYFCTTLCSITLSYFIPFMMQDKGMTDIEVGVVNAMFYLFLTIPGFCLNFMIKIMKLVTVQLCVLIIIGALLIIAFLPSLTLYIIGSGLLGFGYGVLQPIFYNKAAQLAPTSSHSTQSLSYVMSANYIGIAICPIVFMALNGTAAFVISALIMAVIFVMSLIWHKDFFFSVADSLEKIEEAEKQ